MNIPNLSAVEVAKALEWSGFGPAAATGQDTLVVRISKPDAPGGTLDFDIELLPDGNLKGFPEFWSYKNTLNPLVRAVLSIVTGVFVNFGNQNFYEGVLVEDFDTRIFKAKATYLWMLESPDPSRRRRLVLNEFIVRGKPVWCHLNTIDYDNSSYELFYDHAGAMIEDFAEHGSLDDGTDLSVFLSPCLQKCLTYRS